MIQDLANILSSPINISGVTIVFSAVTLLFWQVNYQHQLSDRCFSAVALMFWQVNYQYQLSDKRF